VTQEKLRDRAEKWAAKNCDVNPSALTVFAREQLQKAAEIVDQFSPKVLAKAFVNTVELLKQEVAVETKG
jgi:hypothetical protein